MRQHALILTLDGLKSVAFEAKGTADEASHATCGTKPLFVCCPEHVTSSLMQHT